MGRIFLSHSSRDNAAAIAMCDWLLAEGWDDFFLDLDPQRGIAGGERWERALNEAANRCEAVVFLVSTNWLASRWCLKEFNLALRLNKRMFGVLVENIAVEDLPQDLTANWQVVRLAGGNDHAMFTATLPDGSEHHLTFSKAGLASLKAGLMKAGLDARFFAWPPEHDPGRAPWRGMKSMEADDAGIFFGREAPVIETLDRLRGLADAAPPRFLAILGASGAGKSSFLRAGLLPRLARDDRTFLTLPVVRPERAIISGEAEGLVASLEKAFSKAKAKRSRSEIGKAVAGGVESLAPLLLALAETARPPKLGDEPWPTAPAIVFPLDQAEELFNAGTREADEFLVLLAGLVRLETPRVILLATIRSDAYERLQTAPALEGVRQATLSLPPMPTGAYQTVIEGPAARLKEVNRPLKIEPALTAQLLADIEAGGGRDALPLLAFTLGRLHAEHGGDGDLTLAEYREMGGIAGSIEAAVERAFQRADFDPAVPRDREARLALLRRGLIPWLAGIDPDTGAPRRVVARLSDIPAEARPLIEHLVAERLLAKEQAYRHEPEAGDGAMAHLVKAGEPTVEPVHEALLRQWGLLRGWLDEDFARLSALEAVRRAMRDWDANARDAGWLAHRAGRLEDAERLADRPDLWARLDEMDRAYLAACREAENVRRDRELAETRKLAEQVEIAVRNKTVSISALSRAALAEGRPADAVKLALAAWPRGGSASPALRRTMESLRLALPKNRERTRLIGHSDRINSAIFSPDGLRVATGSDDGTAKVWSSSTGVELATLASGDRRVGRIEFSSDGRRLLTTTDGICRLWCSETWMVIRQFGDSADPLVDIQWSRADGRIFTRQKSGIAQLWEFDSGRSLFELDRRTQNVSTIFLFPTVQRAMTVSGNTLNQWDIRTGAHLKETEHEAPPIFDKRDSLRFGWMLQGKGKLYNSAFLVEIKTGREIDLSEKIHEVGRLNFSITGSLLCSIVCGIVKIWDLSSGKKLSEFHEINVYYKIAKFSPDDLYIFASGGSQVSVWDIKGNKIVTRLIGHDEEITSFSLSPNGTRVITSSSDCTSRIWDAAFFQESTPPILHAHHDAILSPDGRHVAVSRGSRLQVYDASTSALVGHAIQTAPVLCSTFSPDGNLLACGSADDTIALINTADSQTTFLSGHGEKVVAARLTPQGLLAVVNSSDGVISLCEGIAGSKITQLECREGSYLDYAFLSAGGELLLTVRTSVAKLWDARTGKLMFRYEGEYQNKLGKPFSPSCQKLVSMREGGIACLRAPIMGAVATLLDGGKEHLVSAGFVSEDLVVTTYGDGTVILWDVDTGARIASIQNGDGQEAVLGAYLSPDRERLATTSYHQPTRLWSGDGKEEVAVLGDFGSETCNATFSPDGLHVLTAASDFAVRLWDARSGIEIHSMRGHSSSVRRLAFSSDGRRLLTASEDFTVRIWDTSSGAQLDVLDGHHSKILDASISADGKTVLTLGEDGLAKLWDLSSGTEIASVGRLSGVTCLAFSPDGTILASAARDGTARLWSLATAHQLAILRSDQTSLAGLFFLGEGEEMVTVSDNGIQEVWEVATRRLISKMTEELYVESAAYHFGSDNFSAPLFRKHQTLSSFLKYDRTNDRVNIEDTSNFRNYESNIHIYTIIIDNFHFDISEIPGRKPPLEFGEGILYEISLFGISDSVSCAHVSDDGTRIITGSTDGTVKIRDAATGTEVAMLHHTSPVRGVAFFPCGTRVMIRCDEIRIWDISSLERGDAFQVACQRLGNDTSLKDVQERYDLGELPPICGDNPPLPVNWRQLE